MPRLSSIQVKALFLLVTFTASFTVFCHCACGAGDAAMDAAMAGKAHHHSCCDKMPKADGQADAANHAGSAGNRQEHGDCQGMQAVKFHLLETQASAPIHPAPAPLTALIAWAGQPTSTTLPKTEKRKLPQQWSYRHSPPNLLSLYQCFLI
jgi:hypothetical protein